VGFTTSNYFDPPSTGFYIATGVVCPHCREGIRLFIIKKESFNIECAACKSKYLIVYEEMESGGFIFRIEKAE
jgi:hypothetical protein